jgi:putative permease
MRTYIGDWISKHLSDPEALGLVVLVLAICAFIYFFGGILTPVLAAVVIAYLLKGPVSLLERLKIPHGLASGLVCLIFIGLSYASMFILLPLLWDQLANLFNELPKFVGKSDELIDALHKRFPDYVSTEQVQPIIVSLKSELTRAGQYILAYSISSISSMITLIVYLILVPLLVFFLLKDRTEINEWFTRFLPKHRRLIQDVWGQVNEQIGRYVNAKVIEIILVAVSSVIAFSLLGLEFSILLGTVSGLFVLVPIFGGALASIPIIIVAYLQWGWSANFAYLVLAHSVILTIDYTVLATLLFSKAVKLHPLAIVIAILIFGGLWGFWGVFFSIPLATIVKAIINAWPRELNKAEVVE